MTSKGPILQGLIASLLFFFGMIQKLLDDMRGIQENPESPSKVVPDGRYRQVANGAIEANPPKMKWILKSPT